MDLEDIFRRNRIDYRTKGSNCSNGYINIKCPLCSNDPSYHLRINESEYWWYCLRNSKHKGKTLAYLFFVLGIDEHLPASQRTVKIVNNSNKVKNTYSLEAFDYANKDPEALAYLKSRNFMFPEETATKFQLRTIRTGKWAGRLIIPLTLGWTGRSMRPHIQPRYLATEETGLFIHGSGNTGIVVEGPLDAMKIAGSTSNFTVIAITGSVESAKLLRTLREQKLNRIHLVLDSNVNPSTKATMLQELRLALSNAVVIPTNLPPSVKDPAEMSETDIRYWIYSRPILT